MAQINLWKLKNTALKFLCYTYRLKTNLENFNHD